MEDLVSGKPSNAEAGDVAHLLERLPGFKPQHYTNHLWRYMWWYIRTCDSSTYDVEAGDPRDPGQPGLYETFSQKQTNLTGEMVQQLRGNVVHQKILGSQHLHWAAHNHLQSQLQGMTAFSGLHNPLNAHWTHTSKKKWTMKGTVDRLLGEYCY